MDRAGDDVGGLEVAEDIGEFDVFRGGVTRVLRVELLDHGGFLLVCRSAKTEEGEAVGSDEIEAFLLLQ